MYVLTDDYYPDAVNNSLYELEHFLTDMIMMIQACAFVEA